MQRGYLKYARSQPQRSWSTNVCPLRRLTILRFAEWAKQYGGMYSIKLASQNAIVLTDRRLVKELMDKRSSVSSNRPPSLIVNTLIYEGDNLLVMQSSDPKWRASRKFIHQNLMASVVEQKQMGLINTEAVQMRDICIAPEDFLHHLKRFGQHHYYEHEYILPSLNYNITAETLLSLWHSNSACARRAHGQDPPSRR